MVIRLVLPTSLDRVEARSVRTRFGALCSYSDFVDFDQPILTRLPPCRMKTGYFEWVRCPLPAPVARIPWFTFATRVATGTDPVGGSTLGSGDPVLILASE